MNSGWIKLHRSLLQWEWFDDKNTFRLFMYLLLKANHKPSRYKGHDIPVGSVVTGRYALAYDAGLSQQQIRTCINKLKSTNEITIKTTNQFSIISITCWKKYQSDNQLINKPITNEQPTDNQQVTTSKEGKKVIKEEEKIYKKENPNPEPEPPPKPKRKKNVTDMPVGWKPNGKANEIFIAQGYNYHEQQIIEECFRDSTAAKATTYANWDAAFYKWIKSGITRQDIERQRKSNGSGQDGGPLINAINTLMREN